MNVSTYTVHRIGIIGAGKVGTTLGKYIETQMSLIDSNEDKDCSVSGYYSRSVESAGASADYTRSVCFESLSNIVEASDTLFITTPDREIGHVWDCIADYDLTGKIICHFSGSLSSNVFSNIESTHAVGASIHPMYAFSDKYHSYKKFNKAYLVMEGNNKALYPLKELFVKKLKHPFLTVSAEDKIRYHAAAALLSNHMIGLYQAGLNLLMECGFDYEDCRKLVEPLIRNNVDEMLKKHPADALTGPVKRGDDVTVRKHIENLRGKKEESIYRALNDILYDICDEKRAEL